MNRSLLIAFLLFVCADSFAQSPVYQLVANAKASSNSFSKFDVLTKKGSVSKNNLFENILTDGVLFDLKKESLNTLNSTLPHSLIFEIRTSSDQKPMQLELVHSPLFSNDFKVSTDLTHTFTKKITGRHYRGIVAGDPNSAVAFSVFDNQIMSVISTGKNETFVLGKLKNSDNEYVFYNKENLLEKPEIECGTTDVPLTGEQIEQMLNYQNTASKVDKCVNVFLECDYSLMTEQGGVEATADYISGLFNAVSTLYQNEGITMKISEIMVWETEDPYAAPSSKEALDLFKATRTEFNGDLAHLISRGAPATGGIAWIGGLCSEFNYGYSYIKGFYNDLPDYSWSVNVIAHEIGHNLGSPHTHACTWNGNNTPIDGCGSVLGYDEGCNGPIPNDGGTIMSYCHLLSGVGVNFTKGFGQQPGDLIRSVVANAACLSSCSEANEKCPTIEVETIHIDCFGEKTGAAKLNVTGGAAPFKIQWSNKFSSEKVENLAAGDYSVSLTDSNDCFAEVNFTIAQTNKIEVLTFIKKENFEGSDDGAVITKTSGGTPPYAYFWSNGAVESDLFDAPAGKYSLIVTDANNCISVENIEIGTEDCISEIRSFPYGESFEVNLGAWNQNDEDQLDWILHSGKTESNETGPNSASHANKYLYLEASRNPFKSAIIESGCIDFSSVSHPKLIFDYHMFGAEMGSLEVFVCENGSEFIPLWSTKGNQGKTWETHLIDFSAFAGKTIRIKIKGVTGRDFRSDIALDNIRIWNFDGNCEKPSFDFQTENILCNSKKSGSLAAIPKQETGSLTYFWSTGDTTQQIENLDAGFYAVTVTDEKGCHASGTAQITQPEALKLFFQKNDATTAGALDGEINLVATGGVAPYDFEWSTNEHSTNLQELSVGMYMATVTDTNGCFATETIEIEEQFAGCTEVIALPYSQSWENGLEHWNQNSNDDFDWTIHSGRTSSSGTGPTKAFEKDFYAYIEASNNYYKSAFLTSPCFNLSGAENPNLTFAYHMYGNQMGSLSVQISADGGENWADAAWAEKGDKGATWNQATISLKNYVGKVIKIRFGGSVEGGLRSDMAIDQIFITDKSGELPFNPLPIISKEDTKFEDLIVFPNPAIDETKISFQSDFKEILHVTILNNSGQIMEEVMVNSSLGINILSLNISSYPEGLYHVKLNSEKSILTSKFIKLD